MTRNAYRLLWLLGALFCCACTTSASVETFCHNDVDEDDDDLMDCDDPDCQATDECLHLHAAEITVPDAGHRRPPLYDAGDGTDLGDAWIKPPQDAATDAALADAQTDAAADEDGGGAPDPCGGKCTASEVCVGSECKPVGSPTSGGFYLRVLSATVPSGNPNTTVCFEVCFTSPPAGFCNCPPDPYVRVVLKREGMDLVVGTTAVVPNENAPTFPETDFVVDLAAGDVMRFVAMDEDEPDDDDTIYTCTVDLSVVSLDKPTDVTLSCGIETVLGSWEILAQLRPRLVGP